MILIYETGGQLLSINFTHSHNVQDKEILFVSFLNGTLCHIKQQLVPGSDIVYTFTLITNSFHENLSNLVFISNDVRCRKSQNSFTEENPSATNKSDSIS